MIGFFQMFKLFYKSKNLLKGYFCLSLYIFKYQINLFLHASEKLKLKHCYISALALVTRFFLHRSRTLHGAAVPRYPRVQLDFTLSNPGEEECTPSTPAFTWQYHTPEEEISLGPACWLWDYLRRSGICKILDFLANIFIVSAFSYQNCKQSVETLKF